MFYITDRSIYVPCTEKNSERIYITRPSKNTTQFTFKDEAKKEKPFENVSQRDLRRLISSGRIPKPKSSVTDGSGIEVR